MNWKLPNQLTVARIILAGMFFILLGVYDQGDPNMPVLLTCALAVYLLAGVTDVLDGYLARKWNLTSAFGRIADPFVDKVLVVGAFVMLTGANFAHSGELGRLDRNWWWLTGEMASGVQAWMVVVILCREFLISAVRGYSESQGIKFPATGAGKIKMFVQSAAICTILVQLAFLPDKPWAIWTKIVMVWLATIVTALSGLAYLGQTRKLLRSDERH